MKHVCIFYVLSPSLPNITFPLELVLTIHIHNHFLFYRIVIYLILKQHLLLLVLLLVFIHHPSLWISLIVLLPNWTIILITISFLWIILIVNLDDRLNLIKLIDFFLEIHFGYIFRFIRIKQWTRQPIRAIQLFSKLKSIQLMHDLLLNKLHS